MVVRLPGKPPAAAFLAGEAADGAGFVWLTLIPQRSAGSAARRAG